MNRRILQRILWWGAGLAIAVVVLNIAAFAVVLSRDALPARVAPHRGPALARLPLIETPSRNAQPQAIVVYYTGDNGWQDGDIAFAQGFAQAGLPVVAIDTLHYFVRERTPERAAADLAAVVDRYSQVWGARRVALVGYSYGANVLPVVARRLPPRLRDRIAVIALIAPADRAELVLRPYTLLDVATPGAMSEVEALEQIQELPVVCIWGADDWGAACPRFPPSLAKRVSVPGGHRFLGQRARVAAIVADSLQPASQPRP
jgi:type IV secretory pathway VirJ component